MESPTPSQLAQRKVDAALLDAADAYIIDGVDEARYLQTLADDLRRNLCEPFLLSAVVMPPGFPELRVNSVITGLCLAHRGGYWLVFQQEQDRFYCFWGTDVAHLGAHGIVGSPLYCWSA